MMKASDNFNSAYLKEVMGLLCQKCEIMVTKCHSCGERFGFADRIYCSSVNQEHICKNCYERKKKVIAVN